MPEAPPCPLPDARVVASLMETALVVWLNSASVALDIAVSDSDTRSVEDVDLGMGLEG